MLEITCSTCNTTFSIKPSRLKDGYKKYCSRACAHKATRTGKMVNCFICNARVYKSGKAIRGSKSGNFFCGRSCQTTWRNTEFSEERHANWKGGKHAYRRMLQQSNKEPVCCLCNITDVRILAVHHIDGDRGNNVIENLAWLCHNCHLLVHHYPEEREKFMAAIV